MGRPIPVERTFWNAEATPLPLPPLPPPLPPPSPPPAGGALAAAAAAGGGDTVEPTPGIIAANSVLSSASVRPRMPGPRSSTCNSHHENNSQHERPTHITRQSDIT